MSHIATQEEINEAQKTLSQIAALERLEPLDTPRWRGLALLCGDLSGWIYTAINDGCMRRTFKQCLFESSSQRQVNLEDFYRVENAM